MAGPRRHHGPGAPRGGYAKPQDLRKTLARTVRYIVDRPLLLIAALEIGRASCRERV